MKDLLEHLMHHLMYRHLIPLLLLPVVFSGLVGFVIFGLLRDPNAISSTADWILLAVITAFGVIGNACTWVLLRAIRSKPVAWELWGLARTAWSVLVIAAWLAGAACGVIMLYETSR